MRRPTHPISLFAWLAIGVTLVGAAIYFGSDTPGEVRGAETLARKLLVVPPVLWFAISFAVAYRLEVRPRGRPESSELDEAPPLNHDVLRVVHVPRVDEVEVDFSTDVLRFTGGPLPSLSVPLSVVAGFDVQLDSWGESERLIVRRSDGAVHEYAPFPGLFAPAPELHDLAARLNTLLAAARAHHADPTTKAPKARVD